MDTIEKVYGLINIQVRSFPETKCLGVDDLCFGAFVSARE